MTTRWRRSLIVTNVVGWLVVLPVTGWETAQLHTGIALPGRTAPDMLLVAHRGDLERFPENTLEGIVAASELGIDGIEIDVNQSAEGTWWVIHDPTLDRTTTGTGRVSTLSDADMERVTVDGGLGFDPAQHQGIRVPRLADVLDRLGDYPGHLYIDVQHSEAGSAASVAELLRGRPATILCRDMADVRAVKQQDPSLLAIVRPSEARSGGAVDGWLMDAASEATPSRIGAGGLPVTTFVSQFQFGSDEAPLLRRAWALGVEAFLTKEPTRAIEIRAALVSTLANGTTGHGPSDRATGR